MLTGVLLINLGTPDKPSFWSVARYLREFLMDRRVINLPLLGRLLLVYGWILPMRTRQTQHAYQSIWNYQGSPLRHHSLALREQLQQRLGQHYQVALGMRYGHPSIAKTLTELKACHSLIILPLYPQYASATTGSSLEFILKRIATATLIPHIRVIAEFYSHPAFIQAQATLIQPYLDNHDVILFSYHGLPERQLQQAGCIKICQNACTSNQESCYRSQCYTTTAQIAAELKLPPERYATSFQSRLGKLPWIQPYTDHQLRTFAERGVKRLAVVCPSFMTDCLETLEEIGIRAAQEWKKLGGDSLTLIPCLNATEQACQAIQQIIL